MFCGKWHLKTLLLLIVLSLMVVVYIRVQEAKQSGIRELQKKLEVHAYGAKPYKSLAYSRLVAHMRNKTASGKARRRKKGNAASLSAAQHPDKKGKSRNDERDEGREPRDRKRFGKVKHRLRNNNKDQLKNKDGDRHGLDSVNEKAERKEARSEALAQLSKVPGINSTPTVNAPQRPTYPQSSFSPIRLGDFPEVPKQGEFNSFQERRFRSETVSPSLKENEIKGKEGNQVIDDKRRRDDKPSRDEARTNKNEGSKDERQRSNRNEKDNNAKGTTDQSRDNKDQQERILKFKNEDRDANKKSDNDHNQSGDERKSSVDKHKQDRGEETKQEVSVQSPDSRQNKATEDIDDSLEKSLLQEIGKPNAKEIYDKRIKPKTDKSTNLTNLNYTIIKQAGEQGKFDKLVDQEGQVVTNMKVQAPATNATTTAEQRGSSSNGGNINEEAIKSIWDAINSAVKGQGKSDDFLKEDKTNHKEAPVYREPPVRPLPPRYPGPDGYGTYVSPPPRDVLVSDGYIYENSGKVLNADGSVIDPRKPLPPQVPQFERVVAIRRPHPEDVERLQARDFRHRDVVDPYVRSDRDREQVQIPREHHVRESYPPEDVAPVRASRNRFEEMPEEDSETVAVEKSGGDLLVNDDGSVNGEDEEYPEESDTEETGDSAGDLIRARMAKYAAVSARDDPGAYEVKRVSRFDPTHSVHAIPQ